MEDNKKAVLAHLRHELRTPLNAIIGYSEMLLEDTDDPGAERFAPQWEKIHSAGKLLLSHVNTVLDASRLELMTETEIDLEALGSRLRHETRAPLSTVLEVCRALHQDAADTGSLNFSAELDKIQGAARKLSQLIDTTIQSVVLGTTYPPAPTEGVAEAPQIPAPVEPAAIALPALPDSIVAVESGTEETGQGHILVVEDSPTNRELLIYRLEQHGYTVDIAANGRRALEKMAEASFDLVLLDVMMPEMDGYEVLHLMKADPNWRHIPVIMISALDEIDSIVRCIEMGAEDYLPKPFNPVLLKARVSACLEKKRLRDQEVHFHEQQMELFKQLEANYQRLQELESLRDSLTGMIVHDLRTPLTSLLTGLQTVELLGDLNEDQTEFLGVSIQGGHTLLSMINDLLDISKMEAGSLTLDYKDLAPADLVERALKQVGALAEYKRITLVADSATAPSALPADEEKLLRILINLLGNSIKFTPDGGTITVSARPAEDANAVLFSVADTGEGIPKEAFQKIFEKFGQVETRKSGRKMSTGLGLTFCKMTVEAHGGRIWVESELGQGSTFLFTIPLTIALEPGATPVDASAPGAL